MIELSEIDPRNGEKYSPNLFQWIRKMKRRNREEMRVYEHSGHLYIGYLDDGYLCGARLQTVLCEGTKAESLAYGIGRNAVEVLDFWERYVEIGRCVIDELHSMRFRNDENRFEVDGDCRTCRWCGAVQVLHRWQETVERSSWAMKE